MKFMMMVKSKETADLPPQALMEAIGKLSEESVKAGTMLEGGGLAPTRMSTRVRLSEGKVTVVDGPFSEAKEVIGGYAMFKFNTKEEAIAATVHFMELHRIHWPGWEGETEVRQIFGAEEFPPRP